MSRICDFRDTTTGYPCKNVVEDGHDHCAARHLCSPLQSTVTTLGVIGHVVAPAMETEDLISAHIPDLDPEGTEQWSAPDLFVAQVVLSDTEEVVHESKPTNKHRAEKIEDGMGINLNWDVYHTRIVPVL